MAAEDPLPLEELADSVEALCDKARSLAAENVRLKQQLAELMEEVERLEREFRSAGQRLAVFREERSKLRLRVHRIREHLKVFGDAAVGASGQNS